MTGATFRWHESVFPPAGMPITQVYGYVFDTEGRVVLLRDGDNWNLPGGTPEPFDADRTATLVREVREEVQVEITDPVYLGYQEVCRPERGSYAQLRMTALLTKLSPRRPDPDKGRVHVRRLAPLHEAMALLNWAPPADQQASCAAEVAESRWNLPITTATESRTD